MKELLDNPQQIWQSQPVEGRKMSAEAIRLRAGKFERKISRRNLRESIAALLVIVWFSYFFVRTPEIPLRITWGLFIAGMIWVLVQLRRKGKPQTMPADMGSSNCLEFFRSELERQRDLVKDVWTWYLAPLVPGYLALNVSFAFPHPIGWVRWVLLDAFFAAVFVGSWQLNLRASRCLQRSIDELNAAEAASRWSSV
jgi:hypothetical protein